MSFESYYWKKKLKKDVAFILKQTKINMSELNENESFGYYKNPCSHRDVEMNFITAFERIVVASDLLKKVLK